MEHSKRFWRGLFFIVLITALCGGLALPAVSDPARAAPQMQTVAHVVISQVYGGGGNSGATYSNDYVELFNPSDTPLSLNGWSIQYAPATGAGLFSANVTNLSGSLAPGQFYLVQLAGGANGNTLPTPDATGSINMNTSDGKVVLVKTTTGLLCNGGSTACTGADLANIVDLVGYGTANFYEGTGAAPSASNILSVFRKNNGCFDTDNNNTDFATGNPTPHNTAFVPISACSAQFTATASAVNSTGTASALTSSAAILTATASANLTASAAITNTSPATTGSATSVVISEFRTRGPNGAGDEFIEIYNPTTTAVDISGWKINASNNVGAEGTRAIIPASTLLRSGQYYLVANNSYSSTTVANLKYGTAISDDGGIALLNASNGIIDEVGMDIGSAYQEGTTLSPLTGTTDKSYERKLGGTSDSCIDTNDNASDFQAAGSGTLHNYSSPLSLCGVARPSPSTTTTTITADIPDPSLVNANVSVSVKVTGGSTIPSGLVTISGANTNCTITLNSSGTGSCNVKFTSTGTKSLIATYLGDNTHASSTDGESHLVSTTTTIRTPTAQPSPLPPPPLIGINEFVPRPGHDWNNDGVINNGDEYIELLNHGVIDVNLSGYSLDDEVNIGSNPYRLPSITLKPGERHVFYGSETGLLLSDGGDGVRLLKPNGQLGDAYNYFVVRFPDQSYCRLPDNGGLDDWNQNCFPTPGLQNSLSGSSVNPPTENGGENLCPILDTLPDDFVLAECPPFGNNIWNPEYWDKFGWFDEKNLPDSPGKWPVFAD
jgi:hypothetical protein